MAIRYQDENGNWVTEEQTAVETTILDIAGNFESENVEGALRELAEKTANAEVPAELEAQVKANTTNIKKIQQEIQNSTGGGASSEELKDLSDRVDALEQDMTTAKEDIEYLMANGGGGGSAVPTITSDFTDCAIDKGTDVVIPIFFTSPNMGDGTAYITVNNIQVDTAAVKQGNNNVRVKAQYLVNTDNNVGIYVKDRAGIVTNRLNWMIIAGGIEISSTFDYEVDYGITDTIRIPYSIDTGIDGTITTYLTIDSNTTEYVSVNGNNFIDLLGSDLGLGTHSVEIYSTVDKYTSNKLTFNIVIISTTELYLSSTFISGSEFTYGSLISVNYRLSKQSTEEFNVYLKIDDKTVKTVVTTVGNYFWTIQSLEVGEHKLTIQVVSMDYSEVKELNLQVVIAKGVYTPVEEYKLGLICDLNAVGKNNTDSIVTQEQQWTDDSGNGHHGKLVNFNFGTNGFVDDQLVCDNDAYVVIEWSPWKQNAITGSTIDLIYTPINSGVEDCRVIDYTTITDDLSTDDVKPFKGVFADILQAIGASASSGSSASKVNLDDENGRVHLTWVLDRDNKFLKTYIDGVLCRIMFLTDSGSGVNKFYEDFSHDAYIYLNSTKGENCGTYNIERFRVYDHALTSEQVLQNELASITDLDEQEQLYNFNYHNTTLPKMYLNGDTTNMTAYQTVPMAIEYISPDEERYGQSFNTGIQNNPVKIQGTSSLQYVRHNYTIYLKDEYGTDMYYNPYGAGSVADYVFCLKADYVESSHANNTGCAKFVNDCLYDTKTPMQLDNENCRTAINGFPIEVYMNGEYLGVYNFNHDRYSYQSYGYDYKKYPNLLVYEINSNSNTSAGAFYRYGDNTESSAGITELEYYKRDFNLIYGNRTSDSDTYSEIKTLVEWVSVAEQDLFRETISEHFNTEYLFRYFLMVLLIGAVDSLGKNLKMMTIDGKVWYPTFYDMDTVLGIDNTGYLTIPPDVEIESGSYNTSNSNLWNKVWNFFRQELIAEWAAMRQGRFTLDNLMDYIYNQQISVIPAKYYNDDAEVKYLQFGSLYTYCCHGNKEHQIRRWLRERIAYVDSMLGYFTSQEDQVTVRMNKTGYVSFDITTYIPLYFSVKWSNASGGTQTFKMARGETKSFYYTSTTSTDQEVIIYHAQYIKALDNLSNLNPSSCILANAKKLTNVEIHSTELYNINVTNNTFLRTINLEGCSTLGTVTATGSSLDLSNCKYLRYCNVYDTALTEVQLNTSGGSLIEIYYPSTLQSMTLIKQRLLETIGLPYGSNGEEVPTALYTVDIQECPNIKYLNTSDDPTINSSFASIYYCNNLTLRNALDLAELNFDGFHRLKNVTIENMFNLTTVGFNNLLPVGNTSTLKYVGFSNCPLLEEIELNCTSDDYEISFDTNSVLNFGGLSALKSISSNCVIKGLDTIVLPLKLENMFFTTEYGEGFSEIKNLWSSAVCNVNINGSTVECIHVIEGYEGIDFANMNLINIDLGGLVNIKDAINFSLYPTTVNPNFNKNRDGVTYPYLQPQGILDLSNYTESLAKFFDGVDLRKLQLICTNPLPQNDLSYCFYNSIFDKDSQISAILDNLDTVNNMEYCFYKTSVKDVSILNNINFLAGTSLAYCFAECANINKLEDITLSGNIGDASYMFSGSGVSVITNVSTSCGNIVGMFSNCNNLVTVTNFDANGTTSYESLFEGCSGMSVAPVTTIPATITSIKNMYKNCDGLVSIDGFVLHGNITEATGFIEGCDNLINANNITISGPFYNDIFRGLTSLKYVNNLLINYVGRSMTFAHMFDGCSSLVEMSFHDDSYVKDVISMDYMFRGTAMRTVDFSNVDFEKVTSIKYMFADGVMEEFSYTVPITIMSIQGFLSGCSNLKTLRNFIVPTNVSTVDWLADTNVENLIDCSFNTQYTKFTDNTSIKVVENLEYTGTDFSNYFSGCTSLESVSLALTSTTTKAESAFANCPNLTQIDFADSDLSNVTSINGMFNGDTSLTTINNLRIVKSSTTANNTTLVGCPISNTDGLYINSNNALDMFRLGEESAITAVTDFELGDDATYLSELFMDNPNITHDIVIPSHVYSVEKMYYNCINLTYVTSNWSNIYDLNTDTDPNNDVVTADCYGECTNIKYIDNELYMNEYGELTAIYSIPEEWGGILNCSADQTAFYINSDLLTEYTITLNGSDGVYITEWGDGTTDKRSSHTYSKSGSFRIVTNNSETFGTGSQIPDNFRTAITRVLHLDETITNGSHLFDGCTNLLEIKQLTNVFANGDYMFNDCSNLLDINGGVTLSNGTTIAYMCNGCAKFTKTPISVISDTYTDISYLFSNSGITDISGLTFGIGISNITSWIPPNLTTANNITIKNNNINFNSCSTLVEVLNLTIPNTVTSLEAFLENCTSLNSFSFNKDSDLSKVTTIKRFLVGNKIISTLDFSEFDLTSLDTMSGVGENLGFIANTNVSYVDFSNCEFGNKNINWIWLTNNCKTQGSITFDFTNTIMPVIYFNRLGWGSGSTVHYFKFNGADFKYWTTFAKMFATDATIINGVDFTDAKFSHITDFSDMFNGTGLPQGNGIYITEDIEFPETATNVERAFYGCVKLTHVHSNWNKTYISGITSADCYAGCTGITHFDGENILRYEGDLGIDYIPTDWGGNGFTDELTGIYVFNIPSDDYTLTFNGYTVDDGTIRVNWGDGSMSTELTHTYVTAGTYTVKGKVWCSNHIPNGTGQGPDSSICNSLIKVLKVPQVTSPTSKYSLAAMFAGCSLLEWADISDAPMSEVFWARSVFLGCQKLKYANVSCGAVGRVDNYTANAMNSYFYLCGELTEIVGLDTWNFTGLYNFDISSMFKDCSSFASIIGIENWDTSNVTNMNSMFSGCSNLTSLDLSSWNLSSCTNFNYMFKGCTKLITPPITTFGNADKPTTKIGYSQIYDSCTFTAKDVTFKVVGSCELYRVFVSCKKLDSTITFEWSTDQTVSVTGLFCEGTNISVLGNFNLTSCTNLFNGYFFGGVGSQANNNLTTFNCYGVQSYNLSISNYPNLSKDSILNIINCLCETTETLTLTLGSTNMAKLTDEEIAIATAKGWTVA